MLWRPPAGTTTLVEPLDPEPGHEALTATVVEDDRLLLDLGASPRSTRLSTEVIASFFTRDALVRVTGILVAVEERDRTLHELVVKDIERVQRRQEPRVDIDLAASMVVPDAPGPIVPVLGRTQNISAGGCRVATDQRLAGSDTVVSLDLADPDGLVIAQATVLSSQRRGSGWEYRLRFTAIDDEDRARLERLAIRR
jgi:c-di-GMP-binding flagellar brake protein YcgR